MTPEIKWEAIPEAPNSTLTSISSARLRVPGGWIVRTIVSRLNAGVSIKQTFVRDPAHEWGPLAAVEP